MNALSDHMRCVLALFLAVAAVPSTAAPGPAKDVAPELKGIRLGETRDEVMADPKVSCSSETDRLKCAWITTLAGVDAIIRVEFDRDERVQVIAAENLDATRFGDVLDGLTSKFGKPAGRTKGHAKNLAGANLEVGVYSWHFHGWNILVLERDRDMSKSKVTMYSDAAAREVLQARDRAIHDDM